MKTVSIEVYSAAELQEHFPKAFIKAKANFLEHHENVEASDIYQSFEACMEYFGVKFKKFPHYSSFFIRCELPDGFDYDTFATLFSDSQVRDCFVTDFFNMDKIHIDTDFKVLFESFGDYMANLISTSELYHANDSYFLDYANDNQLFFDKNGNVHND